MGKKRLTLAKYEELIAPIETAQASVRREIAKLDAALAENTTTSETVDQLCALVRTIRVEFGKLEDIAYRRRILD